MSAFCHLQREGIEGCPQSLAGMMELLLLLRSQVQMKNAGYAVLVQDTGDAYEYFVLTVVAGQAGGNRQNAVFSSENGPGDPGKGHADSVVGSLFGLDDFIGGILHILGNLLQVGKAQRPAGFFADF